MILRDRLALDRTQLANERTLLAYLRTSIMMFASGVTLLKIFEHQGWWEALGWCLIALSPVMGVWGFVRYRQYSKKLVVDAAQGDEAETKPSPKPNG